MMDFILKYWLQFLFGIITACISAWCGHLSASIKHRKVEQDALKTAMIAILHDRLFQECNQYLALGYIPVEKSEAILDNVKIIYDAYHTLGGNGTGTDVYNKFKSLKIRQGGN